MSCINYLPSIHVLLNFNNFGAFVEGDLDFILQMEHNKLYFQHIMLLLLLTTDARVRTQVLIKIKKFLKK